tara:strand:+ start:2037 stop:2591 length:555 start_codon:yes stop_codon:yes gene_type:complete
MPVTTRSAKKRAQDNTSTPKATHTVAQRQHTIAGAGADDASFSNAATSPAALFIVYGLVVLYALCYQLQKPIEPFLVDKLLNATSTDGSVSMQDSAKTYANLKSVFSFIQMIGSLIFGGVLDKWGVRVGLIINFTACATFYYILSITDTIALLYLSRIPGVAMAGEYIFSLINTRIILVYYVVE